MKHLIALLAFSLISTSAFSHPGGNSLVCRSTKNSVAKQKVELLLHRANGIGWVNPTIEIKVDAKKYLLNTPDENNNYGSTFHNSPLKVITVTAEVSSEENTIGGYFSVVAMPETVKAFDSEGKPVKWTLEAEKDGCNDSNGKAIFKGIIRGSLQAEGIDQKIDAQIMDCTLTYNSGMAC